MSRRHQPSSLISIPVASLPDLELVHVCAPRSSLSTQKYKPKVGGQITLLSLWSKFWRDASPLSTPVIYATGYIVQRHSRSRAHMRVSIVTICLSSIVAEIIVCPFACLSHFCCLSHYSFVSISPSVYLFTHLSTLIYQFIVFTVVRPSICLCLSVCCHVCPSVCHVHVFVTCIQFIKCATNAR